MKRRGFASKFIQGAAETGQEQLRGWMAQKQSDKEQAAKDAFERWKFEQTHGLDKRQQDLNEKIEAAARRQEIQGQANWMEDLGQKATANQAARAHTKATEESTAAQREAQAAEQARDNARMERFHVDTLKQSDRQFGLSQAAGARAEAGQAATDRRAEAAAERERKATTKAAYLAELRSQEQQVETEFRELLRDAEGDKGADPVGIQNAYRHRQGRLQDIQQKRAKIIQGQPIEPASSAAPGLDAQVDAYLKKYGK